MDILKLFANINQLVFHMQTYVDDHEVMGSVITSLPHIDLSDVKSTVVATDGYALMLDKFIESGPRLARLDESDNIHIGLYSNGVLYINDLPEAWLIKPVELNVSIDILIGLLNTLVSNNIIQPAHNRLDGRPSSDRSRPVCKEHKRKAVPIDDNDMVVIHNTYPPKIYLNDSMEPYLLHEFMAAYLPNVSQTDTNNLRGLVDILNTIAYNNDIDYGEETKALPLISVMEEIYYHDVETYHSRYLNKPDNLRNVMIMIQGSKGHRLYTIVNHVRPRIYEVHLYCGSDVDDIARLGQFIGVDISIIEKRYDRKCSSISDLTIAPYIKLSELLDMRPSRTRR